jgi:hypothetical protein
VPFVADERPTYDEQLARVLVDAQIGDQHRRTALLWVRLAPKAQRRSRAA